MSTTDAFGEELFTGDIIVVISNRGDFDIDLSKGQVTSVDETLGYVYYETLTGGETWWFTDQVIKVGERYSVWLMPFRRDVPDCQDHEFCRDFWNNHEDNAGMG